MALRDGHTITQRGWKGQMNISKLVGTVAYCGLICGVCRNIEKGCQECRGGGGADDCYQRRCCLEGNIDGCWQCDAFPCEKGFFADEEWKDYAYDSPNASRTKASRSSLAWLNPN